MLRREYKCQMCGHLFTVSNYNDTIISRILCFACHMMLNDRNRQTAH